MLTCENKNIVINAASDGDTYYYKFTINDNFKDRTVDFILDESELSSLTSAIETIKEMAKNVIDTHL